MYPAAIGHVPDSAAGQLSSAGPIARRADLNRDGEVTSPEFAAFLERLVQSLDDELAREREAASQAPSPEPVEWTVHGINRGSGPTHTWQGAALLNPITTHDKGR